MYVECSEIVFCPFCGCSDLSGGLGWYGSKCPECGAAFAIEELDESEREE